MNYGSLLLTLTLGGLLTLGSGCSKQASVESEPQEAAQSTDAPMATPSVPDPDQEMSNMEDTVLVTVEGKALTQGMASSMVQEMALRQGVPPQMLEQFVGQMGAQMQQQVLEQFINQTLVEIEAERQEFAVTDLEIDGIISNIVETLPPGATLEQALAEQEMSAEDLRQRIVSGERVRMLFESKTEGFEAATDEQVQTFYTENEENFKLKEGGVRPFDSVSEDIRSYLDNQAREKLFGPFVESLREAANIEYPETSAL